MGTRAKEGAKQQPGMADSCRPIAGGSPIPMAAVEGARHIVRYVNPAFCRLIGKPEEELIGNAFRDAVPAQDECLALLDRVYRSGQAESYTGEEQSAPAPFWSYAMWPALAADGRGIGVIIQVTETTPAHEQSVAINQALMLGSVHQHELTEAAETLNVKLQTEIAQRQRVEEELYVRNFELAQSRDFAQSIVESVSQPLIVLDSEMRVRSANQAFCQCFQVTSESTVGQPLYCVEGGRWDIPELRALLSEVLPANKSFEDFELELEFAKVGHKILLVSARQLEHVQMILFSINDITERRKAEAALRRTEDRLRHAQKMEAVGKLAGGIAHDFNNLLTSILGYSELLLESVDAGDNRLQRKNLQVIKRSAERAAELTKQLLAFSRRQVLQPEVLALSSVIMDLERMLRTVLGEHIELVTDLGAPRGFVRADPAQIGHVIMNLALNARDAMFGGGTLTLETRTLDIGETSPVEDLKPGPYVMLAVTDTGVGMDEETQSHLFEPFFTTRRHGLGTGLGLATALGIVEQSGGHIGFSSKPGHGTTFRIYFPRVEEPAREAETPQTPREPPGKAPSGSEIVLVAEDEDAVRTLTCHFLESRGYKVLEASHGAEALAICRKHQHIDLLLTDVKMPGMGGRELAEQARPLHPEMKVIFMSGYTDDSLIMEGVKVKGDPFLKKPFTLPELAHKVRDVLDRKKAGQSWQGL